LALLAFSPLRGVHWLDLVLLRILPTEIWAEADSIFLFLWEIGMAVAMIGLAA
jgi:hypothetical protein